MARCLGFVAITLAGALLVVAAAAPVTGRAPAAKRDEARRSLFGCNVTFSGGDGSSRELSLVLSGEEAQAAFDDVAGAEGPDCAADVLGAAAAAVAGTVIVGLFGDKGTAANIEVRWGECPGAATRAALEARARIGRISYPHCRFVGHAWHEITALCSMAGGGGGAGGGALDAVSAADLAPYGFIQDDGVPLVGGRWPAFVNDTRVLVCSTFSWETPATALRQFVEHLMGLGVAHVYLYDTGARGAAVAAARAAVPPRYRRNVTFVRLPRAARSATESWRTCVFSAGHAARWVLYAEPNERLLLARDAPTLPAFLGSPAFAAASAVMLRVCGECGSGGDGGDGADIGATVMKSGGCGGARPLVRFGRVSIEGTASACTVEPTDTLLADGLPASIYHAVCGDTAGDAARNPCDGCAAVPHMCRTAAAGASGAGRDAIGTGAGTCNVSAVVPRLPRLPSNESTASFVPAAVLQRAWSARPRTRAPRIAYTTMVFGDVEKSLARLGFMLSCLREVTAADMVVMVPQGSEWVARGDVAAAVRAVGATLWPVPSVRLSAHCIEEETALKAAADVLSPKLERPVGYFSPTYLLVHAFALAAYDSVVYIDATDTVANRNVDESLAAFARGRGEWGGRSDGEPTCPAGRFQVNTGILFLRPSRALHAYVLAEHTANAGIGCLLAVQDLMNSVLWSAFGTRGLYCLGAGEHCGVGIEECHPRVARITHYAGSRKPWVPRRSYETPADVARAAEYNARFADWRDAAAAAPPPPPCWPGAGEACAVLPVTLAARARDIVGEELRGAGAAAARVFVVPCTPTALQGGCRHITCCLPRGALGALNDGHIFVYYGVGDAAVAAAPALASAASGVVLYVADIARGVYGGTIDVVQAATGTWVQQPPPPPRAAGSLPRPPARLVIAFDPASHITARLIASAHARGDALLVLARPREALRWAASVSGAPHTCVIVGCTARLISLCPAGDAAAAALGGAGAAASGGPAIWLPADGDVGGGAAALAASLAPCASALWAHRPVAAAAAADCHHGGGGDAGCGDGDAVPDVRAVPFVVARSLRVHVPAQPGDERLVDIFLLSLNAISDVSCSELRAAAAGDGSSSSSSSSSVQCEYVGNIFSGEAPTAMELALHAGRARAVVVSYDGVLCASTADDRENEPAVPVPPPVAVLSAAGARVVAWCVGSLYRPDAHVCCRIDAPATVIVVRTAAAAVAAANFVTTAVSDVEAVSAGALKWWAEQRGSALL